MARKVQIIGSPIALGDDSEDFSGLHFFDPYRTGGGKALLVRLRSLGDTVLMTPGLEAIRRVPGWQTAVVVEEPFDQLLQGNPQLDRIFPIPHSKHAWLQRLRVIRRLRAWKPDLAIDLHGGSTSSLITRLSEAAIRVGYAASRHSRYYSLRVPDSRQMWRKDRVHTVEHQLSPLRLLGFPTEPVPAPFLPVGREALRAVRSRLQAKGVQQGFILVHPAAAFETKQWEAHRFAELIDQISPEVPGIVLTAGPGQEGLLEKVARGCRSDVCVLDPMSLTEFAALASRCGLYIGNDTGTTHMASALGKKVVVIFGSSDWRVWRPWNTEYRLIRAGLDCIPCPGYRCGLYDEPRCIRSIEVEEVVEAVRELLGRSQESGIRNQEEGSTR